MKKKFKFEKIFKYFICIFLFIVVLIFQSNFKSVNALPMDINQSKFITEELRLKVSADYKKVWLIAEKNIWDPWLSNQKGFLGRQIFWDPKKEEALILVQWKNKELWKSISMEEVNKIQEEFEENVKRSLDLEFNPIELIYEGELKKEV